jgi:hypothetical protein
MSLRSTIAFALLLCFALPAQFESAKDAEKSMPPVKVATKVDKNGLQQWDKSPNVNCPACKAKKLVKCTHCAHLEDSELEKCVQCHKTRKAPCNYCQGKGALVDPLAQAMCPGCWGRGVLVCGSCANRGVIRWVGGGKKGQKCGVCKGHGGVPCEVCKGSGLVPSAFKGKVGSQKLKKLKNARKNLSLLIRKLESFHPKAKGREDRKKFSKMFAKVKSDFPVLKKLNAFVDTVMKRVDQPNVKDNHKEQAASWRRSKSHLLYYLVHQGKVIDACIKRIEANENAVAAPKK